MSNPSLKRRYAATEYEETDRKILIAIDFGTTYSGIAWSQTRKPDVQTTIIQWPDATSDGLEGVTSEKVPTELQYDGRVVKWGFQIGESKERFKWFKLSLDPAQDWGLLPHAKPIEDSHLASPGYGRTGESLTTDYLAVLRKHAIHVLSNRLPKSALETTPIEYVITVPAVWSDAAQAKTRSCAEKAGMGSGAKLHIISEPEAAAIYALHTMDTHNLNVGDTFVLCDAGGGTVDLISYRILALEPALELEEAAPGTGSLSGSTFLDRMFAEFLQDELGDDDDWDDEVLQEAVKRFELEIKRSFRNSPGEEFYVPVHGLADDPEAGVRRGKFHITGAQLKGVFQPVIDEIIRLVKGQVRATKSKVKAVLLVGGLGQNAYLRDCIRNAVASSGIEVMQSPNGWTAVVRGALMRGLMETSVSATGVKITARVARKHYGIRKGVPFVAGVHDESQRYWDSYHGAYRIGVMDWFVKKGTLVRESQPLQWHYTRHRLATEGRFANFNMLIQVCNDADGRGAPMYEGNGVSGLVTLTSDLSRIPMTRLEKVKGNNRKKYHKIHFSIQVTFHSAYTTYELIHQGKNYGAVRAEYV
ncbi:hypothetical protein MMC08_006925 [Hypocenomyce scalaris]|nr:hypothetical protein [Hypocenomyce scalaris]